MKGRLDAGGTGKPERPRGQGIALFLGSIVMLVGGLIMWQASGGPEWFRKALVPPWMLGGTGLVFFCGGLSIVFAACGAARASSVVGVLFLLMLTVLVHYAVFDSKLSRWSGPARGGLNTGETIRIGVVTLDLLIVLGWVLYRATFVDGKAGPLWQKLAEEDPSIRKAVVIMLLLVPVVLAAGLHYAGVLDLIGAAFR